MADLLIATDLATVLAASAPRWTLRPFIEVQLGDHPVQLEIGSHSQLAHDRHFLSADSFWAS